MYCVQLNGEILELERDKVKIIEDFGAIQRYPDAAGRSLDRVISRCVELREKVSIKLGDIHEIRKSATVMQQHSVLTHLEERLRTTDTAAEETLKRAKRVLKEKDEDVEIKCKETEGAVWEFLKLFSHRDTSNTYRREVLTTSANRVLGLKLSMDEFLAEACIRAFVRIAAAGAGAEFATAVGHSGFGSQRRIDSQGPVDRR